MKNLKSWDDHGVNEDGESSNNEAVTISDYMESRQYNKKLYSRLLDKLKAVAEKYRNGKGSHPSDKFPTLKMEISMSAKYQTPYIKITTDDKNYEFLGGVEGDVNDAIDEIGFSVTGTDEKNDAYFIEFDDQ